MTEEYNRPRTPQDYHDVRTLHAAGLGRNDICRETGRSAHLVSAIAAELGLSFARAHEVRLAMETRVAQLAERRMILAEQLQTDAENLRAQLWQPTKVYAFGGRDNTYEEHTLDQPPAADKKNLMATVGMAIDRSLKLVPPAGSTGAEEALSMLGSLAAGFARIEHEEATAEEG